jgi:phage terminase large subunit-like protein
MSDGSVARLKRWFVLPRFFIPAGRLEERVKLDKQPFDKWLKAGAVTATPGDVIDQNALHKLILQDAEEYDLRAVMVDRWNATQFVVNLRDEGIEAQMFGQGFGSMSGPSKWLERAVLLQQIDHGGHPVLRWCASNVAVVEDHAENIKPSKDESTDRIDGIVATIMAVGGCDEFLGEDDPDGQIVEVDFGNIRGS